MIYDEDSNRLERSALISPRSSVSRSLSKAFVLFFLYLDVLLHFFYFFLQNLLSQTNQQERVEPLLSKRFDLNNEFLTK